ncbi:hypothetical protein N431DRAFT_480333 [Stipitochalara longipes BDJ]|nr:hypothetical protein N431DRAFT_480333 [Stipitochalara longipes BDJ]
MSSHNQDLTFIPAYLSAFSSAHYALARNPAILAQILAFITSIFEHCSKSVTRTTLEIWRMPDLAMIPICVVWAISVSSIVRSLEFDRLYCSFMLAALSGTIGLGWAFDLTADLVVFGLLPFLVVSSLLVTRLVQNMGSPEINQLEEGKSLPEKP